MSLSRREFVAAGAAKAATALAPVCGWSNSRRRVPEEAVTKLQRWGLLIDVAKCAEGLHRLRHRLP